MQAPLTQKQQEVYVAILNFFKDRGFSPTLDELRKGMKIKSLNTVVYHLTALENKGYISRMKHTKRNIEIKHFIAGGVSRSMVSIPVLASVGCDDLSIFANEQHTDFLEVDRKLIGNRNNVVAVHAVGDSMNDANIENGDYILVEPTNQAENGDRVVAIIDGMVTVKKLTRIDNIIILNPESNDPKYKPIILNHDFKIAGKVICSIPKSSMEPEIVFEKIIN